MVEGDPTSLRKIVRPSTSMPGTPRTVKQARAGRNGKWAQGGVPVKQTARNTNEHKKDRAAMEQEHAGAAIKDK